VTGVILMYHRVSVAPEDAYGLAVTPDRFAAQLEHLSRLGCVVPLNEIVRPASSLQMAITFDDGYLDNATTAAPMLAEAGLPATYFITTGRLDGRHFWWDRLATALLGNYPKPSGVEVPVARRTVWLALNDPSACESSLRFVHRRLRSLPPDELEETVDDLLERLGAPAPPARAATMTRTQLVALSRLPAAEVGAHTRTHLQLGGKALRLQEDEVMGSVADLADILGKPVRSFAYPFGSEQAVGDVAPRLADRAGCALACTTVRAPVVRRSNPYRLPRLNVGNWGAAELAAHVEELSHDI
jgi:peptidoglycan/xylan/chitin deacetylase (PgdA/CDA1 family)